MTGITATRFLAMHEDDREDDELIAGQLCHRGHLSGVGMYFAGKLHGMLTEKGVPVIIFDPLKCNEHSVLCPNISVIGSLLQTRVFVVDVFNDEHEVQSLRTVLFKQANVAEYLVLNVNRRSFTLSELWAERTTVFERGWVVAGLLQFEHETFFRGF